MKRHALRAALGLLACLAVAVPALAIVGGDLDTKGEHQNVGAVLTTRIPDAFPPVIPAPQTFGSCTLIHPRVVLTAAHVVEFAESFGLETEDLRVSFALDANADKDALEIEKMIKHPDYVPGKPGVAADPVTDIAVIILKEPVVGIDPVPLAPAGLLDDLKADGTLFHGPDGATPFRVVGYGSSREPPLPDALVLADGKRRIGTSEFQSLKRSFLLLDKNFFRGLDGASSGDSGGPALWKNADGEFIQVALVSAGDAARVSTGSYARTDRSGVLSFIDDAIDEAEGN